MAQMDWVTVRVSRDTLAQLEAVRRSMNQGDEQSYCPLDSLNCGSGEMDKRDRIGLDRVIRRLLLVRAQHAARRAGRPIPRTPAEAWGSAGDEQGG